ncbi:polysaccharide biosynthesis protein [Crocinitomicaceae bacterium CZZ-1]|uniref:Polysaccharide biosynthesis protein n=1 Tax=Taishania pollutisoli TaxID=2766479 RepID=A0A8J6TU26_9FLAO|nr:nucleoside-diphosphate sugar epimerase/dehydratase [Taishania pollutisoli]MBC9813824.1 polysaccharide biosynthesis protein [Taishania pollutisoli]
MQFPIKNTPRWLVVVIDLFIAVLSLALAYLMRFDLHADRELIASEWSILSKSIGFYFVIKLGTYFLFRIHKRVVRHTSTIDIRILFFSNFLASLLFLIAGLIRFRFFDGYFLFPTTVLILEFMFSFTLMIAVRFAVKLIYLESVKNKHEEKKVLIYGAGISGLVTKRTIEKDTLSEYKIVAFIDDNKKLSGNILEGLKIFHTSKLEQLLDSEGIDLVILAIQEPDEEHQKKVVNLCFEKNVELRKVPTTKSWINGEFSTKQIKSIKIEDLLGRSVIRLDEAKIKEELTEKVVLVTGAAGSIGSGMVQQILKFNPQKVILLDNAESPMYDFVNELKSTNPFVPIEVVIGDIRQYDRMKRLFDCFRPSYILHAAAYKHVPLMEDNPSEAVLTNVKGTKNLVDLAVEFGVQKFVMVSTDKAVNPTNVMGASKRIAEIYAQNKNRLGKTKFITTRFGNVLGSNGSVIPLFKKQIEQGGPITVTDDRITRYFMTIPEACQLVLEASTIGEGGEIFVFDMGESVKIIDLAKKMIKLSGLEVGKDIEIKITGLRPGEKLYEELLSDGETTLPTHHPKILKAKVQETGEKEIAMIEELIRLFEEQENKRIVAKMKEIVPEFKSNNSIYEQLDK